MEPTSEFYRATSSEGPKHVGRVYRVAAFTSHCLHCSLDNVGDVGYVNEPFKPLVEKL